MLRYFQYFWGIQSLPNVFQVSKVTPFIVENAKEKKLLHWDYL